MKTEVISTDECNAIDRGVIALREGKIIAFPTDTVYGVAASAFDPDGIEKLFEIKERTLEKAIAVLIGAKAQIYELSSMLLYPYFVKIHRHLEVFLLTIQLILD